MGAALSFTHHLETLTCCSCGVEYAVPQRFLEARRDDKREFYCPNGHAQVFRKSRADELAAELAAEKRAREIDVARAERFKADAERIARSNAALRGHAKATRERIANGVCPCCKRSFANLRRHMGTKHPDFKAQEIG